MVDMGVSKIPGNSRVGSSPTSDTKFFIIIFRAGVAQLAERLICNQQVEGSSPFASSNLFFIHKKIGKV